MAEAKQNIRVRFAPSPTGYLHVGGLRTALYNYLFARKQGGRILLRIEDTDRTRFVPDAVERLLAVFAKLGLSFDEGPSLADDGSVVERGESGPYVQSARLALYQEKAEGLVAAGVAYYCFCDAARLAELRKRQQAEKTAPGYDRHCLRLSKHQIEEKLAAGTPKVIRLRIPDHERIVIDDLVRGTVAFDTDNIDDQILLKSDGYPTYHLANVVDDRLMGVTHCIRAEEWLPSTPKHILLYRAFGWETPVFAHLPLLLNQDRSKLSKRQGDVAVEDYLAKGYLPEVLINFVALLGWNPGEGSTQEIFSLDELVEKFDLRHVHKAGAVFDLAKLDWLNAQYLKRLPPEALADQAAPFWAGKTFFEEAPAERRSADYLQKVLVVEQERLVRLDEVGEEHPYFFVEPEYETALLHWKNNPPQMTREALGRARELLAGIPTGEWERDRLAERLLQAAGEKRGDFLWPLRVALSGRKQSPPPGDLAWVLGPETVRKRLDQSMAKLESA